MKKVPLSVVIWLVFVAFMILSMVAIGGITRLTGSGLSMVDWKPIMGAIPPLNEAEWQKVFAQYQQFPQYELVNHWMTLADFKQIFFWEYLHRLWGRLIGLVFFVPFVFFWVKKMLSSDLKKKLLVAFVLGGGQGVLGWVMVMSGLVNEPAVSHYRLAAHLLLAFFLFVYINWILWDLVLPVREASSGNRWLRPWAWSWVGLVTLQVVFGAFVAGKKAGYIVSTFPTMNGEWWPSSLSSNFLNDPLTLQFIHRGLGWAVFFCAFGLAVIVLRRQSVKRVSWAMQLNLVAVFAQFILGVLTIVWRVPVAVATLHQVGGCLLFTLSFFLVHSLLDRQTQ